MGDRGAEVLDVIAWHLVRVGAQRGQLKACDHGIEGKRVYLDVVIDIFPTEQRWEIVVGPGQHGVAAKFPGVASALQTESFGQMQSVLGSLAWQD